jgi:hypothetical protein
MFKLKPPAALEIMLLQVRLLLRVQQDWVVAQV